MSSIRIAIKASLEEMMLSSLKFPSLATTAEELKAPAKMNCVISSPTCVRSLSTAKSNGRVDAPFSADAEHTQDATSMPEPEACSPLLNHVRKFSTTVSSSSTISSEDPNERSNAIGLLPRGLTYMESVSSSAPAETDFVTDGIIRSVPETSPTDLVVNSSNNSAANAGVGYITCPTVLHNSLPCKQSSRPLAFTVATPAPITFVGIILERPETLNSWGLIFVKDKGGHALVVRVIPPTNEGPTVKWCQITTTVPNSSTVYRRNTKSATTLEEYESFIVRNFPSQPERTEIQHENPLSVPYLMSGDAILSVNGIPISALDTGQLASYIRGQCQRKIIMVVMRHEIVLKAGQTPLLPPIIQDQRLDPKSVSDRASASIKEAWGRILASRDVGPQQNNQIKRKTPQPNTVNAKRPKIEHRNSAFQNEDGKPITYCDNYDLDPDDGNRIHGFISDEIQKSFGQWHSSRKSMWKRNRVTKLQCLGDIHRVEREYQETADEAELDNDVLTVVHDFWRTNGHNSFETWLSSSKANWARSYSWHHERRNALQSKCTKQVHFPEVTLNDGNDDRLDQLVNWLSVRKHQWKLDRRKRNRHRSEMATVPLQRDTSRACFAHENMYFDEILKDEEQNNMPVETSQPIDITWIFDSRLGAPDDVIANLMTFLCPSDHGNLLCLSYTTNFLFNQRNDVWKALFPSHWVVPRRPRKSLCAMYITKIRAEEDASRKRSDDLLIKANTIMQKGDQLSSLEKLIDKAIKDFEFSVNYTSGVVLERNSLLNMAVIDRRHKVTKWLIEEKGADIESCDRGLFTPLMNAAWNGDRYVTRYLLARGCDRTKVGFNHSSQGLAPPKFEGLTAEGWARKRGHDEVAELIRLGL